MADDDRAARASTPQAPGWRGRWRLRCYLADFVDPERSEEGSAPERTHALVMLGASDSLLELALLAEAASKLNAVHYVTLELSPEPIEVTPLAELVRAAAGVR